MCFNAKTSLITFLIGTIGSLLLIYYGNPGFKKENIVFGIFLIFISAIQLMDFFFWIDITNKIGFNRFFTLLGPFLNVGQPIILWIIKLLYFRPNIWSVQNFLVTMLNLVYISNLLYNYVKYVREKPDSLITGTKQGHLSWPWIKYSNPWFYLVLFAINIFYLTNLKYSLSLFLITYLFLLLSLKYFKYNPGELWCFFGAFIPFIILFMTSFFN